MKLTDEQRSQVEQNLGLVNVHIRRFVSLPRSPHRQREYDDLYQEGCLALMQAAKTYDPRRHGPFAAYAIPRIHHAISIALYERFATVRVPAKSIKRARERRRNLSEADRHRPEPALVDTHSLADGSLDGPVITEARHRPSRAAQESGRPWRREEPTLRSRLREKYEAAVREAANRLKRSARGRQDRDALIQRFVEDRLLVPEPDARTSKRQLARDFKCSIGRVQSCEDALIAEIRALLSFDEEFQAMIKLVRRDDEAMDRVIDGALAAELNDIALNGFAGAFACLPADQQAEVLRELVRQTIGSLSRYAARLFGRLNAQERVRCLGVVMGKSPGPDKAKACPDGAGQERPHRRARP